MINTLHVCSLPALDLFGESDGTLKWSCQLARFRRGRGEIENISETGGDQYFGVAKLECLGWTACSVSVVGHPLDIRVLQKSVNFVFCFALTRTLEQCRY